MNAYDTAREELEEKTKAIVEGRLGYVAAVKSILSLKFEHEGKTIRFGFFEEEEKPPIPDWEVVKGTAVEVDTETWAKILAILATTVEMWLKDGWVKSIKED